MKRPRIYLPIGVTKQEARGILARPRCQRCGRPLVLENGVPLLCWCGMRVKKT